MKRLVYMFLIVASGIMHSQTQIQLPKTGFSSEINITVLSLDFSNSVIKINRFIQSRNLIVQSRNDNRKTVDVTLLFSGTDTRLIEDFAESLGVVTSKKLSSINNQEKITDLKNEIGYLKNNKLAYEDLMQKMDAKMEKYTTFWAEARAIDERIFAKERELNFMIERNDVFVANLILQDEITVPENSDVSFVNMPGAEFSFLKIENPQTGVSSKDYSGYFLKYLLTRGKSFAVLGAYKSNTAVSDSTQWGEMFVIGFGQDFYSRHFGDGNQSFFNLYSGYIVGYAYLTNKFSKGDEFFISPTVGLELYKNKYFLWDSKVSYFIPFEYNKNLRGISYSTSFNFVF
ncbi:MAG: hypothetical protein KJ799_15410 [Bacteroidetes bacterium]|nr:hypothetical protein [Bacteroidota bacterium]MBU2508090.1 hypothetical protein [Bacteroidota bacterium]